MSPEAEALARVLDPGGGMSPTWRLTLAQRAIDAGWTPPPPTLAEAVAAFREVWSTPHDPTERADARDAMFDALDREADQ